MSTEVDLRQLKVERPDKPSRSHSRALVSRYVIPAAILLGFTSLVLIAAKDSLVSRRAVQVVPVIVSRGVVYQSGVSLFQAAGWVEPRPTPIMVSALAEGVIEELLVVEGQTVSAGEPLARLSQTDARLALEEAEAEVRLRDSDLTGIEAELLAVTSRLENPLHLKNLLADAQSQLAKIDRELTSLPTLIAAATARLTYARSNAEGKRAAAGSLAGRIVEQAESEFRAAEAELQELQGREPGVRQEAAKLRERVEGLSQQASLLVDEKRAVSEAKAKLIGAQARADLARLMVDRSKLRLERMTILAPVDGRVLKILASPGTLVGNFGGETTNRASAVVTLYQPDQLQVRADVRLEDVPLVVVGQRVRIETASSKSTLNGTVLQATSSANIQKNTLEVKVSIDDPPAALRPEMLVSTTFLAPELPKSEETGVKARERILIPRNLISDGEGAAAVWIVNASGLASRRSIQTGGDAGNGLVEVVEGLVPTDKLIDSPPSDLTEGERLTITGNAR
ncbi:MAG: HlyD family efflux transporter periplasmic adaptor subunit [Planctomycetia bacterium]|nr:HlyD family efflux transporter periplasmic adaptor subunit [Planctomycetia bacterium]